MTQEGRVYASEDSRFSVAVLHAPQSSSRTRSSASTGPTIVIDRQPSNSKPSHHKSASTSSSGRRRPNAPTMSLPKLGEIQLNSLETSQIVGTPFATDPPFEYPFPEGPHPYMQHSDFSSRSVSSASSPGLGSALITPPLGNSSYALISASTSPMMMPGHHRHGSTSGYSPPSSSTSSSTSSSITSSTSSFASVPMTHAKLKPPVYTNPPIPPSLIKKRPKWSLNLIGRRKSGYEGGEGDDDEEEFPDLIMPHRDDMRRGEY